MKQGFIFLILLVIMVSLSSCRGGQKESTLKYFAVRDYYGNTFEAHDISGQDITVIVPKGINLKGLRPVFETDGFVMVRFRRIASSKKTLDFSDYAKPTVFRVHSGLFHCKKYRVRVIDTSLPVMHISTPGHREIAGKENWIDSSSILMDNNDGTVREMGASIRGRGNFSWEFSPKNSYNIKFDENESFFGLPSHKRWRLMAGWFGILNNCFYLEAGRRCSIGWSPRGEFVELVLNGKWMGIYWLCEHINISEWRMNIAKMDDSNVTEPEISGGYLLEYCTSCDEDPKFITPLFDLPVMVVSHDSTSSDCQIQYIKDYISEFETILMESEKVGKAELEKYIDMDNFCDYLFIMELVEKYDFRFPRSVYMHKDRNGRLRMGPLWDMDYAFSIKGITGGLTESGNDFSTQLFIDDNGWFFTHAFYYDKLMENKYFREHLHSRWPAFAECMKGMDAFLSEKSNEINYSAERDYRLWADAPSKEDKKQKKTAFRSFKSFDEEIYNISCTFDYNMRWVGSHLEDICR